MNGKKKNFFFNLYSTTTRTVPSKSLATVYIGFTKLNKPKKGNSNLFFFVFDKIQISHQITNVTTFFGQ